MKKEKNKTVEQLSSEISATYRTIEQIEERKKRLYRKREEELEQLEENQVELHQMPLTGMSAGDLAEFDYLLEVTRYYLIERQKFYDKKEAMLKSKLTNLEEKIDYLSLERAKAFYLEEEKLKEKEKK